MKVRTVNGPKRVLFVNPDVTLKSGQAVPRDSGTEPVHLLRMARYLADKSEYYEDVGILDARRGRGTLNVSNFVAEARDFRPDLIMMTYYSDPFVDMQRAIREAFPQTPIISGGYFPQRVVSEIIETIAPQVIVRGQGENVVELFHEVGFDLKKVNSTPGFSVTREGNTMVVVPQKKVDFDKFSYQRLWAPGDYQVGGLISMLGCLGICTICTGSSTSIYFRDPSRIIEEYRYLREKMGFNKFFLVTPDITACPSFTQRLFDALSDEVERSPHSQQLLNMIYGRPFLQFFARPDTFYAFAAHEGRINSLSRFARAFNFTAILGLESAYPQDLVHIKKCKNEREAIDYVSKFWGICMADGFSKTISWLPFTPWATGGSILFNYMFMNFILNNREDVMLNSIFTFNYLHVHTTDRGYDEMSLYNGWETAISDPQVSSLFETAKEIEGKDGAIALDVGHKNAALILITLFLEKISERPDFDSLLREAKKINREVFPEFEIPFRLARVSQ